MTYVSYSLMETVWQKVGAKSPDKIPPMQKRHRKDQKTLTKFAYSHLLLLREDAAGVGLYTFHVIVEAFSGLAPRPRSVRLPAIDRVWALPAAALDQKARLVEPHAASYLEDALAEKDDVVLTDEEQAYCSRVVQAAILCLHEACECA